MKEQLRVQRERDFKPHHVLLRVAYTALKKAEAEEKQYRDFNNELVCIMFSALALEALCNAFGKKFIPEAEWENFEKAKPKDKLKKLCKHLDIKLDFNKNPMWQTVNWLVNFRNDVAHARPELVTEEKVVSRDKYERMDHLEYPASKFEKEVSLKNAKRAFDCVHEILIMLCEHIPVEELGGLLADGWSSNAEPCE